MISGYNERTQRYAEQIGTVVSVSPSKIHANAWSLNIEYTDGTVCGPLSHRVRHAHINNNKQAAASLLRRD